MAADGRAVKDVMSLLSSCHKKFLVSGTGDNKVPISFLEGKAVGFYFYAGSVDRYPFLKLVNMTQQLKERGENFELVFVCLHLHGYVNKHTEEHFNENFQGTPLLAFPFSQRKSNEKLYRLLNKLTDAYQRLDFVTILPGENIAHTYALPIFLKYGIDAYPFSKSRLIDIEVARLKSLTLDQVLFSGDCNKCVIGQDGEKIPAAHLVGKNILLFLTTQVFPYYDHVFRDEKVIAWYNELKCKYESFEMIRVLYNPGLPGEVPSYDGKMPWLEFPYDEGLMDDLGNTVLGGCHTVFQVEADIYSFFPMCVTFGPNGRFITMSRVGKAEKCRDFFDDVHLYGEVRHYIAKSKKWSIVNEESGEFYIPW